MAMDGLFKFKPLGYLLRLLGAFPVKRGTMDRRAIEEAMDILAREGVVYIFPEGGIKRLSRGEDLRKGISLIAQCTGVPLVPMGITGCRDIYRFWKIFLRRVRITIRIGKPFWLITEPNVSAKKTREKSMQRIKRELCTLAAEEMISH
jgi:1-acyl-sn-glycerol-3-phosphate acyltransferase